MESQDDSRATGPVDDAYRTAESRTLRASMYEVELKFPIAAAGSIVPLLEALGAQKLETLHQRDVYFRHPSRDFAQTNEALRVRTSGNETRITYKGPVIDTQAKVRREIELPIGSNAGDGAEMEELLSLLGFEPVRAVEKLRTPYHLQWEGRSLEVSLDEVTGLGSFLEIEGLADERQRDAVRDAILRLASRLGLANPERKSYLRMLLEKDRS